MSAGTAEVEVGDSVGTGAPRRGGRPPCAPEDRRVHYLTVGFTERQLDEFTRYAQEMGLSTAGCVRFAALELMRRRA